MAVPLARRKVPPVPKESCSNKRGSWVRPFFKVFTERQLSRDWSLKRDCPRIYYQSLGAIGMDQQVL